jgi:mannitol-1-phosphate 5-dehydrogenase
MVLSHLSESIDKDWVTQHVGFSDCSVDRIVPPFNAKEAHAEPLDVGVESFYEWVVDRTQLKEPLPDVKWKLTENLRAYNERKLFTLNTGHCITAYLGYIKGQHTIAEAIANESILATVHGALEESGAALCKRHGFKKDEHEKYVETILHRFRNPSVKDDVARVGRQPLRKLSREDRLVGPALMCRQYSIPMKHLLVGIAAALLYDDESDPQAKELQKDIADNGLEATVAKLTSFEAGGQDLKGVLEAYEQLKASK